MTNEQRRVDLTIRPQIYTCPTQNSNNLWKAVVRAHNISRRILDSVL